MSEFFQRTLNVIVVYAKVALHAVRDFFQRSSRAMSISRRTLLTVSAFLTIWYSALQVKGACGALSPMQCLVTPLAWASPKLFGRLEAWARPAAKEDTPGSPPNAPQKAPTSPPSQLPPSTSQQTKTAQPNSPPGTKTTPVPPDAKRPPGPKLAPQPQRLLSVGNRGREDVTFFWASACSDNDWGKDRLGAKEVIRYGSQRTFDLYDGTDNCCFDLRVRFSNGLQDTARNIDVCRVRFWPVSSD